MAETVGEILGGVRERLASLEATVHGFTGSMAQQIVAGDRDVGRSVDELRGDLHDQGERFGSRLDEHGARIGRNEQRINDIAGELARWKNLAIGVSVGAGISAGGVSFFLQKVFGGG